MYMSKITFFLFESKFALAFDVPPNFYGGARKIPGFVFTANWVVKRKFITSFCY